MGIPTIERVHKHRARKRQERLAATAPDWSHVALHLDGMPAELRERLCGGPVTQPCNGPAGMETNEEELDAALTALMVSIPAKYRSRVKGALHTLYRQMQSDVQAKENEFIQSTGHDPDEVRRLQVAVMEAHGRIADLQKELRKKKQDAVPEDIKRLREELKEKRRNVERDEKEKLRKQKLKFKQEMDNHRDTLRRAGNMTPEEAKMIRSVLHPDRWSPYLPEHMMKKVTAASAVWNRFSDKP
jgi:hypothetical protein